MVTVTITIKEGALEEFKEGFLKHIPRLQKYETLTDIQFFKKWIEDNIKIAYERGKIAIAQETTTPTILSDIVEVT